MEGEDKKSPRWRFGLPRSSAPHAVGHVDHSHEHHREQGASKSNPTSPHHSPRFAGGEKGKLEVGKNRAVRPSVDVMREALMSMEDGVMEGENKFKFRTFEQSFVASKAIDWLGERYGMPRKEGIEFCQTLLDQGWMRHVAVSASRFLDSTEDLFVWCREREKSGTSSSPPPATKPKQIFTRGMFGRSSAGSGGADLLLTSSAPSLTTKKKSMQCLTFGKEAPSLYQFIMEEPSFKVNTLENPLQVSKSLQTASTKHLKSVSLHGMQLAGDLFLLCMSPALRNLKGLSCLDLSENALEMQRLCVLFQEADFASNLKDVRLRATELRSGDEGEALFWDILLGRMQNLEVLDVSRNRLTDASAAFIGQGLSSNMSIHTLFLDENYLTPLGQKVIVHGLVWNAQLRSLSMTFMHAAQVQRSKPNFAASLRKMPSELSLFAAGKPGAHDDQDHHHLPVVSTKESLVSLIQQNVTLTSLSLDGSAIQGEDAFLAFSRALLQNEGLLAGQEAVLSSRMLASVPVHLCFMKHVKVLDLSHNSLLCLPWSLLRLQFLEELNIGWNLIESQALPIHIHYLPRLRALTVEGNPFVEALPQTVNWRNTNELLRYFYQAAQGTFTCHRARVVVLGECRSGRTSVAQRLSKQGKVTLEGEIAIHETEVSQKVSIEVWDFSAEIMSRPTHQFFLFRDSIFVLVVSLVEEASFNKLEYWIDLLLSKLEKAHVLIVATFADRCSDSEAKVAAIRARFKDRKSLFLHSVIITNARTVDNPIWDSVRNQLGLVAENKIPEFVGHSFPAKAIFLKSVLQAQRHQMAVPILSLGTLRNIARTCRIKEDELEECFHWLEYSAGVLFFDSIAQLRDIVVIDMLWLVRVMNAVAASSSAFMSAADIGRIFPFPLFLPANLPAILKLLEGFAIVHTFNSSAESKIVIPFLLGEAEPSLAPADVKLISESRGHTYKRVYEMSVWLHGLFDQLMTRLLHVASRHCAFWRKGFVFITESPQSGLEIISAKLESIENGTQSRVTFDVTTSDRSGRILHLISTNFESLVRGWFPSSSFRRLVISGDTELDLDMLGEELMQMSSLQELRNFSRSFLRGHQQELPDILLNHTRRIQWGELSDLKELGAGGYGMVYKATFRGHTVAVKQVKSAELLCLSRPQAFALFLQECWSMNFLQHPKIINLVGVCFQPMSMILDFMELGDCRKFLDTHQNLPWPIRLCLLSDIAEGMAFAHSQWPPIVHKDLKTPNVFLTRENNGEGRVVAKVADLGLAEVLPKASKVQGVDNPIWAAVEMLQGGLCTEKVDVWSFAIMMWEMLFPSDFPYNDALEKLRWMSLLGDAIVSSDLRPTISMDSLEVQEAPTGYLSLMQRSWEKEPDRRPSFVEICLSLRQMLLAHEHSPTKGRTAGLSVTQVCAIPHKFDQLSCTFAVDEVNRAIWLASAKSNLVASCSLRNGKVSTELEGNEGKSFVSVSCNRGSMWLCDKSDTVKVVMPNMTSPKQHRLSAEVASFEGSLDSIWRVVTVGEREFAIGSLRGKLTVGEWMGVEHATQEDVSHNDAKKHSQGGLMDRLAVLRYEFESSALLGAVPVDDAGCIWLFTSDLIIVVDVNVMSVSFVIDKVPDQGGAFLSLVEITSLFQVWAVTAERTKFVAWDYAGKFVGMIPVPEMICSAYFVQDYDLLCVLDLQNRLSLYSIAGKMKHEEAVATFERDPIASCKGFLQDQQILVGEVSLDDVIRDAESSEDVDAFATSRNMLHYVDFLRFMAQLRVRWDASLARRVLAEFLAESGPKSVLPACKGAAIPRKAEFSREDLEAVERELKVFVEHQILDEYTKSRRKAFTESNNRSLLPMVFCKSLNFLILAAAGQRFEIFHIGSALEHQEIRTSTSLSSPRAKTQIETELGETLLTSREVANKKLTLLIESIPIRAEGSEEARPRQRGRAFIQPRTKR